MVPVFQGLLFVTIINNNNNNNNNDNNNNNNIIIIIMIDYSKKCMKAAYELRVCVFLKNAVIDPSSNHTLFITATHNYPNTWLREIHYLLNFCATCPC